MAFFALFSTALNAQTTAPRDSVEVLSEEELQRLLEEPDSVPQVAPTPEPTPQPSPDEDYFPEPPYDPALDEVHDLEPDYVEDTVKVIDEDEELVVPDVYIEELDFIWDIDTVVEEATYVEDIKFDAVIPFPFFVNDGGKEVYFSRGNLQYQGSTQTWRFARKQYEYVGGNGLGNVKKDDGSASSNNEVSRVYKGWIDLFGFGTSGWNSGAKCYQPYSNEIPDIHYKVGKSFDNDLTEKYENADWGIYNIIDGYSPGQWYTLTADEWKYVVKERPNADKLCGFGTIEGVKGFILLPDAWDLETVYYPVVKGEDDEDESTEEEETAQEEEPEEKTEENTVEQTPENTQADLSAAPQDSLAVPATPVDPKAGKFIAGKLTTYKDNVYTETTWAEMESQGAVFLPAGGNRRGIGTKYVNQVGFYYSSSISSEIPAQAYVFFFTGSRATGMAEPKHSLERNEGCNVRLVQFVTDENRR